MKTISNLFDHYGTDKNDNDHGYGKYYQQHLPEKINKFMEIGVWQGAGIKAFKDFYDNEGEFHVINYLFGDEIISVSELDKINVIAHEGKQEDTNFLKKIKDVFSVIVDDGSHHSDAQLITFKQMFLNNLESCGLYVVEDCYGHIIGEEGDYWRRGKVNTAEGTIIVVMNKFNRGEGLESQYFTKEESDEIVKLIEEVFIYDDKIIFIKKKAV